MRKPRALLTQQGNLYYISQQLDLLSGVWGKGSWEGSNARRDLIRTEGWRKGQIKHEEGRSPGCYQKTHKHSTPSCGVTACSLCCGRAAGTPSWAPLASLSCSSTGEQPALCRAGPWQIHGFYSKHHRLSIALPFPKDFGLEGLSIPLRATQHLWSPHCQLLVQPGWFIFYNIIFKGKVEKIKACLQCKGH